MLALQELDFLLQLIELPLQLGVLSERGGVVIGLYGGVNLLLPGEAGSELVVVCLLPLPRLEEIVYHPTLEIGEEEQCKRNYHIYYSKNSNLASSTQS